MMVIIVMVITMLIVIVLVVTTVGDGRDDVGDFNGCHNGDSVEHAVERDGGYNCGYANCDDCILFMMKSAGSYHVMVSYDGNL